MNLEAVGAQYALNDGEIHAVELSLCYTDPTASKASISLMVRKRLSKESYESCLLTFELNEVTKVLLDEDFTCGINYSDIVLKKLGNELYYLSLDPASNSGEPHEEDNLVFVAHLMTVYEA